jgi:hypothetical protein
MPEESTGIALARLEERVKAIFEEQTNAKESRKHQYEQLTTIGQTITSVDQRLRSVEASVSKSAPTIEEFITIKHKVVGAGIAGKWLWAAGGFILSAAVFLSERFQSWLK